MTTYNPYRPREIPITLPLAANDDTILPGKDNGAPPLDDTPPPEPTPFEVVTKEIDDLFDEAKNFCDGAAIDSEALADAITELHDKIHAAGKRAEDLRVAEKKPLDDQIAAIQTKYAPLVADNKSKKGKVPLGKEACQSLLTPWRVAKAAAARAEAERVAKLAAEAEAAARAAMAESAGNLEARVVAEQHVENAKAWTTAAKRAEKAATVGLGLRTIWVAEVTDWELAMDWAYSRDEARFRELVQAMADEAVRGGQRAIPGVVAHEEKRAA
jgi:hypothetical protein